MVLKTEILPNPYPISKMRNTQYRYLNAIKKKDDTSPTLVDTTKTWL